MKRGLVTVVVPAYNESDRVARTLRALQSLPEVAEIIVVDDGSTDRTADRARAMGALVLRTPVNRGKGAALSLGMGLAVARRAPYVAMIDADLCDSARELRRLLTPLLRGDSDVSVASPRAVTRREGFGVVKALCRIGLRVLTGRSFASTLSGQRAMRRKVAERIRRFEPGYGLEFGLTADMLSQGMSVSEVEVEMDHRHYGRGVNGLAHRGKQFLDISRVLLRRMVTPGV